MKFAMESKSQRGLLASGRFKVPADGSNGSIKDADVVIKEVSMSPKGDHQPQPQVGDQLK